MGIKSLPAQQPTGRDRRPSPAWWPKATLGWTASRLLLLEAHGGPLRHLVGARLVGGRLGLSIGWPDHPILEHPRLDLVTTHVRQNVAVDLHAWLPRLAGLLDHFLEAFRAVDDVPLLEGQVVLLQHRTHPRAPPAPWLQPCHNPWFLHSHCSGQHVHGPQKCNPRTPWDGMDCRFAPPVPKDSLRPRTK